MRRLVATSIVALMTAATGLVVGASSPAAAKNPEPTRFALRTMGLGTLVKGGELPASSGKTAYRVIACTNRAPLSRTNHVAQATVEGLGEVSEMTTRVWTTNRKGVVSSNSAHSLQKLVIRGGELGKVVLENITSRTSAWHDDKGFHASKHTTVGRIVHRLDGVPTEQELPTTGDEELVIPGLARITLGANSRRSSDTGARASATALKITVIPTDTKSRVAFTTVQIGGGVKSGLFRGNSNATRLQAVEGNPSSGPNPFLPMPCEGTDGVVQTNDLADLNLGDQIVVGDANTEQRSKQTRRKAWGYEKSSVAELNLGDGQLVIQGIVAQANVTREGKKIRRNVAGTTIGSITASGEAQEFPDPGESLVIPGVGTVETRVVDRWKNGIKVTSVRVTLEATGTVISLGQAQLRIMRSGL